MKKIPVFLLILFLGGQNIFAQNNHQEDFKKDWLTVDSFLDHGYPQSAGEAALKILKKAQAQKDVPNLLKAQVTIQNVRIQNTENAWDSVIAQAGAFVQSEKGIEKAYWQMILANYYYQYYQGNRYEILGRTDLTEQENTDFKTWSAAQFFRTIDRLYLAALEPVEVLQKIPAAEFSPILTASKNVEDLHPTLYDVFVYTALEYFENPEVGITQPLNSFELSGGKGFLPAAEFVKVNFKAADSQSRLFHAILIYQQLLKVHLENDPDSNAFYYADLKRLNFVYQQSNEPGKDIYYWKALNQLLIRAPDISMKGMILWNKADFFYNLNENQDRDLRTAILNSPDKIFLSDTGRSLPEIRNLLAQIIRDYPNTLAAFNAKDRIRAIEEQQLSFVTEATYIPGENIKALLQYKNVKQVYFRLYRIPSDPRLQISEYDSLLDWTANQSPVQSFNLHLKGSEDFEAHSTEFKVDSLPPGNYALIASLKPNFARKDSLNFIANGKFQVSRMVVLNLSIADSSSEIRVLDRKTGAGLVGIRAQIFTRKGYGETAPLKLEKSLKSDLNGALAYKGQPGANFIFVLSRGTDTLVTKGSILNSSRNFTLDKSYTNFLFTDRSIYRPGQTIYFKGIRVASSRGFDNRIIPHQKVSISLINTNGQQINSMILETDEFGAFFGSLQAPEGGLTGLMSLRTNNGSVSFSVEEYKRPKFYIDFAPVQGSYVLNHQVKVKGRAQAYAGNNLDGAQVSYTVKRQVRFPYYWWYSNYYPHGLPWAASATEITHGTTTTDTAGYFFIDFNAIPDLKIDPRTLPVFDYQIQVEVTDINGETHSADEVVRAGYRSVQIISNVPQQAFADSLGIIGITTQNLNNAFVPLDLKVSVYALKFPEKLYRGRIWANPDRQIYSEADFHAYFPLDEYNDESDYRTWDLGKQVFSKEIKTTEGGSFKFNPGLWTSEGWYVIVFKGVDSAGQAIEDRKFVYVVVPGQKPQQPLVVLPNKKVLQSGEELKIWVNPGFDKVHLNGLASVSGQFNHLGWQAHTVREEDRGGVNFNYAYFYENRLYQSNNQIQVPWTNRDLSIEWATHRDKLLPGATEQWILTIKGEKKNKVSAQVLAEMYDASLDALKPHSWFYQKLLPTVHHNIVWIPWDATPKYSIKIATPYQESIVDFDQRYPRVDFLFDGSLGMVLARRNRMFMRNSPVMMANYESNAELNKVYDSSEVEDNAGASDQELNNSVPSETPAVSPIRSDFRETAFFYPDLRTDSDGNVSFSFTLPEAMTEWKFMAFAHTVDWKTGILSGTIKTQKNLMVQPNLPRFLRQGDEVELSSKVVNLSNENLSGSANLEILNANTLQPMNLPFHILNGNQHFTIEKERSTSLSWKIRVPEAVYEPVIIRITAKAGNFSDGEDNPIAVVSDRVLVTEALPFTVTGVGSHKFSFKKLLDSQKGIDAQTLLNLGLTVEFTGNPTWYAVQALPYLIEYPYECSEQTFNRFYANALAQHIVQQTPKIEQIFNQWSAEDTSALISNLEKNQELKSALIEETPWVLEGKSETEQKHQIASLFETHLVAKQIEGALKKLVQMQSADGSFSWFPGMSGNRYITQYILSGVGRLQELGVKAADNNSIKKMLKGGLSYTDKMIKEDYQELLSEKRDLNKMNLDPSQIQYLYLRSRFITQYPIQKESQTAFDYYLGQMRKYWSGFNPYLKGMMVLTAKRLKEDEVAIQIVKSLEETAVHNEDLGMYWKSQGRGYSWYESGIEAQSMLIAAFTKMGGHQKEVAEMKTWLLRNKQTSNWSTTVATADAVYALLLSGGQWLDYQPTAELKVGNRVFDLSRERTQVGTGYFKTFIPGLDVRPEMGNLTVNIKASDSPTDIPLSWGAVYWQYFQDMDKVTEGQSPLSLEKELYLQKQTDHGPLLTRITPDNFLKVGDRVVVRIILRSDRDLDYVHLKDLRASGFEPLDVLSGYHFQNGLGYYQSTRDLSTNFFFDRLKKGTYVLEYSVFVNQKGSFSNGISTVQCMYAPEFNAHSQGIRVEVR